MRGVTRIMLALMLVLPSVILNPSPVSAATATVSVRDHGAKGDGVADDSAAVQKAVDAAGNATVVFPPGVYRFSNIILRNGSKIEFQSGASAKISVEPTSLWSRYFFAAFGTDAAKRSNISIVGGTFSGNKNTVGVLWTSKADSVVVTSVNAAGLHTAVMAEYSTNVTVRDSSASQTTHGFFFNNSQNVTVTRCTTTSTRESGVMFYNYCRYVTASDNVITDFAKQMPTKRGAAIEMYASRDGAILRNQVSGGHYDSVGLRFRDSSGFRCEDNQVTDPSGRGIAVDRVGDFPQAVTGNGTIAYNRIVNANSKGIDLSSSASQPVRVLGNIVTNTRTISGGTNIGQGIRIATPSSVVVGNTFDGTDGVGVCVEAADVLVARNTVKNPVKLKTGSLNAIWVNSVRARIVGNQVVDGLGNLMDGVYLQYGASALVERNTVTGESRYDTYLARGTRLTSINGDVTPPALTLARSSVPSELQLSAQDVASSVAAVIYEVDGSQPRTVGAAAVTLTAPDTGVSRVTVSAIDTAGNMCDARSWEYSKTSIAPVGQVALSGSSRYDTAVLASSAAFQTGTSRHVVIATGETYADALTASALAGSYGSPLLLTTKNALPSRVAAEVQRVVAPGSTAIIVGGTAAVSSSVASELKRGDITTVLRIAGSNRYDTAAKVALAVKAAGGATDGVVYLATGANFPDALAISPVAYAKRRPILLTERTTLPAPSASALAGLGANSVYVLGGTVAVSDEVAKDVAGRVSNVHRIAGSDRYRTASNIAQHGYAAGLNRSSVALATADNFPDALGGGPMIGRLGGVMLLTTKSQLAAAPREVLTAEKASVDVIYYLGGRTALSDTVRQQAASVLGF